MHARTHHKQAHKHVRDATKILPPGSTGPEKWWEGQLKLLKVNKVSLKGKSTQTKRYHHALIPLNRTRTRRLRPPPPCVHSVTQPRPR
jgi:hypothetical protein